ncbi:MAG: MarR family transcriptional regulator [Flavobacteriales bacterium]|nr:MarR family transcriptional regulator [Flavobacteriales bacterium]
MEITEDRTKRFIGAMVNLLGMMKASSDDCCEKFGGMSHKEFSIINYIGQFPDVRMKDIAEHMNAPISTLTSIVDKLVENNYLTRYHSAEDRRVVMVTLAKAGRGLFDMCIEKTGELATIVLSEYVEADQDRYIDFLENIPKQVEDFRCKNCE